eukprot:scaffold464495_cov30-Prasinocladus_malaysianus.AAC.1
MHRLGLPVAGLAVLALWGWPTESGAESADPAEFLGPYEALGVRSGASPGEVVDAFVELVTLQRSLQEDAEVSDKQHSKFISQECVNVN